MTNNETVQITVDTRQVVTALKEVNELLTSIETRVHRLFPQLQPCIEIDGTTIPDLLK